MPLNNSGALPPPSGWTVDGNGLVIFITDPVTNFTGDQLKERYEALRAWANENSLRLTPYNSQVLRYGAWAELYVFNQFTFEAAESSNADTLFAEIPCPYCRDDAAHTIHPAALFCEVQNLFLICRRCRTSGLSMSLDPNMPENGTTSRWLYCDGCLSHCGNDGCENRIYPSTPGTTCTTCDPRSPCAGCLGVYPVAEMVPSQSATGAEVLLCATDARNICGVCSNYDGNPLRNLTVDGTTQRACGLCHDKVLAEQEKEHQVWPDEDMPISGSLVIPASEQRPVRSISIETEFDGNGSTVARALYRYGLIPEPGFGRYSSQGNVEERYPAMLKSDATVSGGELVTYALDLSNEQHAAALQRVTEVMRAMNKLGQAHFRDNAGGHIHMDMHAYGRRDCWNQYTIFRYLETPLYMLAGAGSEEGGLHRSITSGNDYSSPPYGGPFGNVEEFSRYALSSSREGIHFTNYFGAMGSCSCGAYRSREYENCTCSLSKATVEWRLWNSSITPRVLHAWIALMQSIAAYCQDNEEITERRFGYMPWQEDRFEQLSEEDEDRIKARLEFIHRELPLTLHERDSIVEACKRSDLAGLGDEYLDGLLRIDNANDQTKKAKKRPPKTLSNTRLTDLTLPSIDELVPVTAEVSARFGDSYYDEEYDVDYDGDDYF